MNVIPLTLAVSLGLALGFLALFWREQQRGPSGGAERDSLQPLADEIRRPQLPRR
ncbi:MAG TPA: hypothetical protein VHC86_13140 [Opitutaceae bacterium]|nr:hypothetical protein [Opitutaceae bacterium]